MNGKRIERIPTQYRGPITRQLKALSTMIQAKRKKLKLTQEQLAEDLDIDDRTIAYIEQRRRYPSLPLLFTICARLGIKIRFQ